MSLHAFYATANLIRDARVTLAWRDASTATFTVEDLPTREAAVLVATLAPGVVLRALVPPAGVAGPQRIDVASEALVQELAWLAAIPPVGAAGIASVIRQGGLDPGAAAALNRASAKHLRTLAAHTWGRTLAAPLTAAAGALDAQARVQDLVFQALKTRDARALDGKGRCVNNLLYGEAAIGRRFAPLLPALAARAAQAPPPAAVKEALACARTCLERAAALDASPAGSGGDVAVRANLVGLADAGDLADRLGAAAVEESGYRTFAEPAHTYGLAGSRPESRAFTRLVGGRYVPMPADQALAGALARRAVAIVNAIAATAAAHRRSDRPALKRLLATSPAIRNYQEVQAPRWASLFGPWRLSVSEQRGKGAPRRLLHDVDALLMPTGKARPGLRKDGLVQASLQVWHRPAGPRGPERLTRGSLDYHWSAYDMLAESGRLHVTLGGRRLEAEFSAAMRTHGRLVGEWESEDGSARGDLELVRGNEPVELR